jgi:hypothetical protein
VLIRSEADAALAIGQSSHAWLSGQLARAWGNERFGAVEPWEEVCLAAEQHDVGMSLWDTEPTLDPATGRPHSFMEMPLKTHLELWAAAPLRMLAQCRYAALLISLHGSGLYARRPLDELGSADAAAIRGFLAGQRELQDELVAALRADPATAANADARRIERNRRSASIGRRWRSPTCPPPTAVRPSSRSRPRIGPGSWRSIRGRSRTAGRSGYAARAGASSAASTRSGRCDPLWRRRPGRP